MSTADLSLEEKPRNGIAGLKHLRHDVLSGMVVSLVSLPLSSGIAIASGMPPVYGLISAIIAGIVFPFLGGAYVTISGPAAGLAPAIMAIMVSFGGVGDADHLGAGYKYLLVVIFMVGVLQILLAALKLARFAAIIPVSVVEGMLASIGLLIIVKQLPLFFGYTGRVHSHEFVEYIGEIPKFAMGMTSTVFSISAACLVLLFAFDKLNKKYKAFGIVPPHLYAVVFGVILGRIFHLQGLQEGAFLIHLPSNPFHGVHSPDFRDMLDHRELWSAAIIGVITLTLIDGVESLATAMAVDRIDPYRRKSQPNRLLFAMGVSNICSSLVGGLTIIPGGVKSKVNVAAGGRTLWANFTNAICLLIYLLVAYSWVNMIPKGVLAAVLIYTGWKMCEPLVWKHMAHIGREQLALFTVTVVATLATDLLWGIIIGICAKLVLNVFLYRRALRGDLETLAQKSIVRSVTDLFRSPVSAREVVGEEYHLRLSRPLVCFNMMSLSKEFERIPTDVKMVSIHLEPRQIGLIDHTACETLLHAVKEYSSSELSVTIVGLDGMKPLSHYHACAHVSQYQPSLA